ncbi:MAG: dTMP kinase [Actinobacteria bacterium RBG_16_68_21]|nr:MAG: dTMP kinase [Actinobacteria bacterium RBG_16_68_21]
MRYIAVEGIDGAGKSMVVGAIAGYLEERGIEVLTVREPGGTIAGEAIREILLDRADPLAGWTEALLFAAARAQLAALVVAPALGAGKTVVSDRCVYSSLAYQGAGRGLGMEAVRAVNEAGLQGVWPEKVLLLRVAAEKGLARERIADRISREGLELQQRVAAAYDALAAAEPDRFVVVDASRPIPDVVAAAVAAVGAMT